MKEITKINLIYLTIFPEYFHNYFQISLAKKIRIRELFDYHVYNIRDFAEKGRVDDYPYGGGAGMVLKIEPLVFALRKIKKDYPDSYFILLSPQGKNFDQNDAKKFFQKSKNLVFICGHYEGFDERILNYIDEQISIGDFITMGGEIPSLAISESLIRSIPGAIKAESYEKETKFLKNELVDFANYTRPAIFENLKVPEVLISGHHKKIEEWRKKNQIEKTKIKKSLNREKNTQ